MHPELNWQQIDSVLLDMDGTLLDLHFDSYFWLRHVPQRYAERYNMTFDVAREELLRRYRALEGTMAWYCVDHWSRELGLDIALLKEEVNHLIAIHPHVIPFLEAVRATGRPLTIVTNAHHKSLAMKMERTSLAGHFDTIICAHDLQLPKEHPDFWPRMQQQMPFDPARTLLVDDSLAVLRSARNYGIRWLCAVAHPDSQLPPRTIDEFTAINHFNELMPVAPRAAAIQLA
jgi:5'-nucleotidase